MSDKTEREMAVIISRLRDRYQCIMAENNRLKVDNARLRKLLREFCSCPASCMDPRICEYCEHCDIDYTDDSKESIQAMSCTLVDDADDLGVYE